MTKSAVRPTLPLDADGVHHGFLKLPHSRDDSAWGSVMIPITVIANGTGPTALLTGANHGDEYEGPRLCGNTQIWYASCDTGVHLCQVSLKG